MNKSFSNDIFSKLVGIASGVQRELGTGLPENIYQKAFSLELINNKIPYEQDKIIPLEYKNNILGELKLKLIVKNSLIVSIISEEEKFKKTKTEMLLFSRLLNKKGLLLDFSCENLRYKRIVYKSKKQGCIDAY